MFVQIHALSNPILWLKHLPCLEARDAAVTRCLQ